MSRPFQLFPEQASSVASRVDDLYFFLVAVSLAVGLAVVGALLFFSFRYKRKHAGERAPIVGQAITHEQMRKLEVVWIAGPLFIFLAIFYWGAKVYATMVETPKNALTMYIVGKRWMWKAQHLGGQREINQLHVPLGQPVQLVMTSEDVIHSFYVPAFRVKQDVLPGRYTTLWFEPTKLGTYHLFCAEYCGTKHSQMVGEVVVMEPAAYQKWLSGGATETLAQAGQRRFNELGCATCHTEESGARGPKLRGLFGSTVTLEGGATVTADETYIRESIVDPRAKRVAGYEPVMPTYTSQLAEENIVELIAYVKSLTPAGSQPVDAGAGTPAPDATAEPAASAAPSADPGASAAPTATPAASAEPAATTDPVTKKKAPKKADGDKP